MQKIRWTNQNSRQIHVADAKRGKTLANKSRFVLVLLLTGCKSGARLFRQSQSVAMQNQSSRKIIFGTWLKTALSNEFQKGERFLKIFFSDFSLRCNSSKLEKVSFMSKMLAKQFSVIYQTRRKLFHQDLRTPRSAQKARHGEFFNPLWVVCSDETLFQAFDTFPKLIVECGENEGMKSPKCMQMKTEYPRLLHVGDFRCVLLRNCLITFRNPYEALFLILEIFL